MVKAFMVRYKFKINENYNHSDYGYQKLFRAIYGYTQVVTKSSGKKYVYHRPGVLSTYPYVKKGKNEVILTKDGFSKLIDFLKTGKNPAHKWTEKGNWVATYSMYDVDVSESQVEVAMENLIKNSFVLMPDGNNRRILEVLEEIKEGHIFEEPILRVYDDSVKKIQAAEWYSMTLKNETVSKFDNYSKNLRSLLSNR